LNLLKQLQQNQQGTLRVSILCIIFIIVTFMIWVATFTPVVLVINQLSTLSTAPEVAKIIRLCNIAIGLCLICEITAYLIWMFADAFKREEQSYFGGFA